MGGSPKLEALTLPLTAREIAVVELMGEGFTQAKIATKLEISARTVEFHKINIYKKLKVTNGMSAVRAAIREGYMKA